MWIGGGTRLRAPWPPQKMQGKAGHPAYFDAQTEKAFMKQPTVFLNKKGAGKARAAR